MEDFLLEDKQLHMQYFKDHLYENVSNLYGYWWRYNEQFLLEVYFIGIIYVCHFWSIILRDRNQWDIVYGNFCLYPCRSCQVLCLGECSLFRGYILGYWASGRARGDLFWGRDVFRASLFLGVRGRDPSDP